MATISTQFRYSDPIKSCLIISLFTLGLFSCSEPKIKEELQEGDILFQDLDCGPLCDAIEAVTKGVDGKDFSHCAMVINVNDTLMVIEAIGDQVQINTLEKFFKRSGDSISIQKVTAGRIKEKYKAVIDPAIQFAKQQIGIAYDDVFLLNNEKWYCSELLYESFKIANHGEDFFPFHYMTFKEPKSDHFFPAWIDYYAELGAEIPEGEAGISPGLISRSDKLEIIDINPSTLNFN